MTGKIGSYQPFDPKKPRTPKDRPSPNVFKRVAQYVKAVGEANQQIDAVIASVTEQTIISHKSKKAIKGLLRSNLQKESSLSKLNDAQPLLSKSQLKAVWITKEGQKARIHLTATGEKQSVLGQGGFKEVSKAVEISGRINLLAKGRLYKNQARFEPNLKTNHPPAQMKMVFEGEVETSLKWSHQLHADSISGASWREDPSQLFLKYKALEEGDELFLTSERLKKVTQKSLFHALPAQKKLYIAQLMKAAELLKAKKILHRDLKIANLLLKKDHLVICDYGLMTHVMVNKKHVEEEGTPAFMPPFSPHETEGDYANRQDDFAFGLMMLQIAFNYDLKRLHFENTEHLAKYESPNSPEKIAQLISDLESKSNPLCQLIAGLLKQPPEERISMENAIALSDQIEEAHFLSFST